MSSSSNGRQESHRDPVRRLRYDDLASTMAPTYAHGTGEASAGRVPGTSRSSPWLPRSHSGRRFVIVAVIVVLVIWGVLYLVFREWRARYRERAAYGVSQVVPAIDPMAETRPAWRGPGRLARCRRPDACHALDGDRVEPARHRRDAGPS